MTNKNSFTLGWVLSAITIGADIYFHWPLLLTVIISFLVNIIALFYVDRN